LYFKGNLLRFNFTAKGLYYLTQLASKQMAEIGVGKIINIASIGASMAMMNNSLCKR
jgi:short-subunit dehydrogenase